MSNRKQRRNVKNTNTMINYNKVGISSEVKHGIIIALIVLIILVVVYFATVYLVDKGNLSTYEPSAAKEGVITYDDINIGMVFNREPNEYYVAFEDFSDQNKVSFNNIVKLYSSNEKSLPIYKVDMSKEYNKRYFSAETNPYAQDVRELRVSNPTLIKIENGTNVVYLENISKIKSELLN